MSRVEQLGLTGSYVISSGRKRKKFFQFMVDGRPRWTVLPYKATRFSCRANAEEYFEKFIELKKEN